LKDYLFTSFERLKVVILISKAFFLFTKFANTFCLLVFVRLKKLENLKHKNNKWLRLSNNNKTKIITKNI